MEEAPGGPDHPVPDTELRAKFTANAERAAVPLAVSPGRFADAVATLDASPDVGADLLALLALAGA